MRPRSQPREQVPPAGVVHEIRLPPTEALRLTTPLASPSYEELHSKDSIELIGRSARRLCWLSSGGGGALGGH